MSRRTELKKSILRHLLLYGRSTRPALVELTKGRAATLFEAIDELKADGILEEPERRGKKTGRRAPELNCRADYAHIIGVELRVSGCCGVIIDTRGKVLHKYDLASPVPRRTLAEARREILALLQKLRDLAGDGWENIRGIGFADPGLVDTFTNRSIKAVNVPGWENLATGDWLNKACGLPSGVWPEAMVKTHAAYLAHLRSFPESLFHLGTDDGIGGGFIKKGELFTGSAGRGMEIGHLVVRPGGPRCQCGNSGCLEAVCGVPAIARKLSEARIGGVDVPFADSNFTLKDFCACAPGNKAARIIADEMCRDIGSALAVTVTLLNPELIVISGAIAGLGDILLDAVRRELELKCFPEALKPLKMELISFGRFETARGAAILMRDRLLLEK